MSRIIQFFRRSRDYGDLASEIQQHLQEEIDALVESGMSHEQAEREARRRFGNVARIEEQSREAWGWRWLEDFVADVHYGVRQFGRNRLFTLAAVVTLALAIGACTSIFSVVDTVLLRKLPYKDSDRLVLLWGTGGRTSNRDQISFTDLQDWRENSKSFVEMANFHTYVYTLTEKDHSERVRALQVSDGYFRVMQTAPLLGRFLVAADQQPGNEHVAVLSYDFWQKKFGGNASVLGKTVTLNLHPYEIIGVAPRDLPSLPNSVIFRPPSQLYTPVVAQYSNDDRTSRYLRGIGLLKPGVKLSQAQAELDTLVTGMQKRYPDQDGGRGVRLVTLKDDLVRNVRFTLLVLQLAVFMIVLIACANVANLLLARSTARQREIAVRSALGASRLRLFRQLLTESMLLGLTGGVAGVLLAYGAVRVMTQLGANVLPELSTVSVNGPVLMFTIATSLLTGLAFGTVPALHLSAVDFNSALKIGARTTGVSLSQIRTRSALIAGEVALSLVLLVAAGLLMKSFVLLLQVDLGFDPKQVAMTFIYPPRLQDATIEQQQLYFRELLKRISSLPGIESAAITSGVPDSGDFDNIRMNIRGRSFAAGERPMTDRFVVSPTYFSTLRIPLLKGRPFNDMDDLAHPRVVLVNQLLADRLFPGQNAIGQQLQFATPGDFTEQTQPYWTITGVVGNIIQNGRASDHTMQMYIPFTQYGCSTSNLLYRTNGDPLQIAGAVRAQFQSFDTGLIAPEFAAMDQIVAGSIVEQRFSTTLLTLFGISGLLLAGIGIYSVISYVVSQRTSEFGTRVALGATPTHILSLVVRQGMRPVLVGVLVGACACVPATRAVEHLLFRTGRLDRMTILAVISVLISTALLACYVPARRATRVDPLQALRSE